MVSADGGRRKFSRPTSRSNRDPLDEDVYPVNSDWGARYEHPRGIVLSLEDADRLGIEIEDDKRAAPAADSPAP